MEAQDKTLMCLMLRSFLDVTELIVGSLQVVMVGPYEHHSNILPWKESGATVLTVAQASTGLMDLQDLEDKLQVF